MASDDEAQDFLAFGHNLVEPRDIKVSGEALIDFDGLLAPPLRLHEDLAEGCGGQLWPAGMVLAKYMLRHKDLIKNKTIIELGAGGGLVGLAIAVASQAAFQKPLHITDQIPMLALMQKNIALNGLQENVVASVYDWGTPPPANIPNKPDVVLAADCVYFEPAFPLLQKTMKDLIGDSTVCYFCFKKRRRADMHFIKGIKKMFNVEEVNDDPDKAIYGRENIFLLKITKR
ncbi:hypothetical protein, variant [Verruconis gallopava]|uniref:Protein-lysine N-methyltransferase EFM6 n=1 Tax=Verruconis gallopava TaxID=253628 RepID=A0A0D1XR59_9PEZI|nr:uncharacterized protein PV09_03730 [Verruconis gallopava]XP_016215051.1 hypothetical protein, variant [Verruconis gallopava]KIW05181.1 hypothetical protein PV09_03730 [Verruconis gallopava]KIW05182.1 hypothetical protein, variant [Verruconis gallopava]